MCLGNNTIDMKNLSLNKENLILNKGSRYIIIDALYIMDIKKKIKDIQETDWKNYLKVSVFPSRWLGSTGR